MGRFTGVVVPPTTTPPTTYRLPLMTYCLQAFEALGWEGDCADAGALVASYALARPPGDSFAYNLGDTILVCRILRDLVGGGEQGMRTFLSNEIFRPLGMRSVSLAFDPSGSYLGASRVPWVLAQEESRQEE